MNIMCRACLSLYVCVCVCMCVFVCVLGQWTISSVFPQASAIFLFVTGDLTGLELTNEARLAGQAAPEFAYLFSTEIARLGHHNCFFYLFFFFFFFFFSPKAWVLGIKFKFLCLQSKCFTNSSKLSSTHVPW